MKAIPEKPVIEMPEYHQSGINMFLKCEMQYMFRYLMGIVLPPKAALTLGSALDTAVTHNFKQKIETKQDLKVGDVLDAYSTDFDKRSLSTQWDSEDPGKQKDLGTKMVKAFHEKASPRIIPVSIQESFLIETDAGYALGGTFDVVDEMGAIRDTKTSKAEYSTEAVNIEIQPVVYSYAYEAKNGKKPSAFVYDVVTKHKEPRVQEIRGQVSPVQTQQLFESIGVMHSRIKRGEFNYAPPGAWWCSKEWCGYWDLCKGKKK